MISLDYEELLERFGLSLLENLRLTGISDPIFELWVPDDDAVRSLQSLLHSIDQAMPGHGVQIDVSAARLGDEERAALAAQFGESLQFEASSSGEIWRLTRPGSAKAFSNDQDEPTASNSSVRRAEPDAAIRDISIEADRPKPAMLNAAPAAEPQLSPALADFLSNKAASGGDHRSKSAHPPESVTLSDGALSLIIVTAPFPDASRDDHIVTAARHGGAEPGSPIAGLLDMLCDIAPGLPVSEIADHGMVRLAEECCRAVPQAKPDSIAAALAFTPEFRAVTRLLRQMPGMREQSDFTPGYSPAPNAEWLDADDEARFSQIAHAIAAFCERQRLPTDSVVPIGISDDLSGWPVRVVVTCGEAVAAPDRPPLIRALEHMLKEEVETSLTVLYEARRDSNKIRRL